MGYLFISIREKKKKNHQRKMPYLENHSNFHLPSPNLNWHLILLFLAKTRAGSKAMSSVEKCYGAQEEITTALIFYVHTLSSLTSKSVCSFEHFSGKNDLTLFPQLRFVATIPEPRPKCLASPPSPEHNLVFEPLRHSLSLSTFKMFSISLHEQCLKCNNRVHFS